MPVGVDADDEPAAAAHADDGGLEVVVVAALFLAVPVPAVHRASVVGVRDLPVLGVTPWVGKSPERAPSGS